MTMTNTAKPSSGTMADTAKVSNAELWSTITTTWGNETRTWADLISLFASTLKPVNIIDSYSESNQDGSSNLRTVSSAYKVAQTFTATTPFLLTSAKFYLKKVGSPVGNSYAKIYALSGGVPTGLPLATSNSFVVSSLSSVSLTLVTFTFSGVNQITLPAGSYAISFEPDDLVAGTNTQFGTDTSSPGHAGTEYIFDNINWNAQTPDTIFYVNGVSSPFSQTSRPS